ncbi:MAG: MBL fold metallo-hydrolase [Paludibacteraceae bacterium]|nr:MBL fold metallo-hydrolase [Paludibacteraceae bacterium]
MVLISIKTGKFLYDGGSLFGVAPKLAWNEFYPADSDNRCTLAMRSLLVRTKDKNILFDTGVGLKHAEVMEEYGFYDLRNIADEVEKCGCKPSEVTDIVLTSLHFEHCGGTTFIDAEQNIALSFPNATVHVGERQWVGMLNANEREKYMIIPSDVMEAFKKDKLHVLKNDEFICPEVELRLVDGHTQAQIVAYIHDGGQTYVFVGDTIPTGANVHLDWLDAHDIEPLKALENKKAILDEAIANDHWMIFPHDVRFACAKIQKEEDYHICNVGGISDCNDVQTVSINFED